MVEGTDKQFTFESGSLSRSDSSDKDKGESQQKEDDETEHSQHRAHL